MVSTMSGKHAQRQPSATGGPARGPMARLRRWLPLSVLVLGLVAFFASGAYRYVTFDALRDHREALLGWVRDMGLLAALVLCIKV